MHAATTKAGPNMHMPIKASPRRAWHGLIQYSSIVVNSQASVSEMFSVSSGVMSTAPRYGGEGAIDSGPAGFSGVAPRTGKMQPAQAGRPFYFFRRGRGVGAARAWR